MSNTGHNTGGASTVTGDFEWPNRGHELTTTSIVMTVLCTLVAVWRIAVRFRISVWLGLSDWLMIGGVILNFVANIPFVIFTVNGGQGRLMADPWWQVPGRTSYELHMIFITQCLNVYAMFLVKASICAYLMALNFGPSYRVLIWVSVVIVVLCNFIMMLILHFAFCRPYYSRWDFTVHQECWPAAVSEGTAYAQIVANIITDLIYAAAPIVYLRHVQLSKRTQWGVRAVFLLALVGTAISVAKIPTTYHFLRSTEPMSDAVDLSICSINEVAVGIIIANLPPLRKTINNLLAKVLPAKFASTLGMTSRKQSQNPIASVYSSKGHTKLGKSADDESERYILELEDRKAQRTGIVKTTHVDIHNDTESSFRP
ncbi:hypothetical protein BU23DRAFT_539551 [Bimuria novae-zelandiae CBS 107.79]|uniref:Rhodopsin domain-containing protein n=1 Tax=Bimuria novae-zelandiae CBS 107.79 TaxID=1447943 RepID=A0A6A5UXI1_9PLEO|nr:hypothetical protein BU23DRAFT_539551 [Bimuria novae-zelandiae CBS 107.79]